MAKASQKTPEAFPLTELMAHGLESIRATTTALLVFAGAILAGVAQLGSGQAAPELFVQVAASAAAGLALLSILAGFGILWKDAQLHAVPMMLGAVQRMPDGFPAKATLEASSAADLQKLLDWQTKAGAIRGFYVWAQVWTWLLGATSYGVALVGEIWT